MRNPCRTLHQSNLTRFTRSQGMRVSRYHSRIRTPVKSLTRTPVSELMSSTSKSASSGTSTSRPPARSTEPTALNAHFGRDALGAYIASPESYPSPSRIVFYDDGFVAIFDGYPKSSVHVLLLPRDPNMTKLHPFVAFADPNFLRAVREKAAEVRTLVATELRRQHRDTSAAEQSRSHALSLEVPPDSLPDGRDWVKEVLVGVHAHPSMNNLHIHVLSVDRVSSFLKHKKHYNSFATPFFVPLSDFPLTKADLRRHPVKEGYLQRDLICWRCHKNFGKSFSRLKDHLDEEYDAWKRL